MSKLSVLTGKIDGYKVIEVGKMKAKKDSMFEEIQKYDSNIKEDVHRIVNSSKGCVFAIVKNKMIKGIYLFEEEKNEDNLVLNNTKTIFSDELSENVIKVSNLHLSEIFKDNVQRLEYEKVIFNDEEIQIDPNIPKKKRIMLLVCGAMMGFMFGWLVFDEIYMGFLYAVILGPMFSGLDVVISHKDDKK